MMPCDVQLKRKTVYEKYLMFDSMVNLALALLIKYTPTNIFKLNNDKPGKFLPIFLFIHQI